MNRVTNDGDGIRASTLRRIVTGRDANGRSVVLEDAVAPRQVTFVTAPGLRLTELWSTDAVASLGGVIEDPTATQTSFVPVSGGTLFRVFEEPPGLVDALPAGTTLPEFMEEAKRVAPGLGESLEADHPGMHTTDSVDYIVVLRGRGALELDDAVLVDIGPGDCIIQNGTRHRWHNTGSEPFVAVAVMVGVSRTT